MGRTSQQGVISTEVQNATHTYAADAEASDAYVISLDPALTAYAAGQEFTFKANTANTGASSLNVDSVGAKTLKKAHDQDTATGDIEAGSIVTVVYDGTVFQITSVGAAASGLSNIVEDTTPQLGAALDTNSFAVNESKGADVASATELNLGSDGNSFDITGTTTITSIATEGIGTQVVLHFDGILTFTHHSTNLILPTGANITTAAGDIAVMYEYASADWRCVSYTRADGTALSGLSNVVEDITPQLGAALDTNSFAVNESKGADVASATALNLGSDGNSFDITGTTTITSIATEGIGTTVVLHFDGILTFTHHSTNLILPGGANITTAAGDIAVMYEYASADWRCVSYTRADGTALVSSGGGAWTLIEAQTPTSGNTVTFNTDIGTYSLYKFYIRGKPTGAQDQIYLRPNGDGTAGNYVWVGTHTTGGGTTVYEKSSSDAEGIRLMGSAEGTDGMVLEVQIHKVSTSYRTYVKSEGASIHDQTSDNTHKYGGVWEQTSAITSFVIDMNGTTWAAGSEIILMGAN